MNIMDRIILTIYMLFMVFISICLIIIPFNVIPGETIDLIKDQLYGNWYYSLVGLLALIASIRLFISGVSTGGKGKKGIVRPAEFGDVKISMDTFQSLAVRAVKQIGGIKDVKISIGVANGELTVGARILVMPDINIPMVVREVQGKIKEYIESTTEVNVKDVKVAIENVATTSAARVD